MTIVDEILNCRSDSEQAEALKKRLIDNAKSTFSGAREIFLYLLYVDSSDLDLMSEALLRTDDFVYMHYLLRSFYVKDYRHFIQRMVQSDDPKYLSNVLYDVDYLDEQGKLDIIRRIIELGNDRYILKAFYRYFVIDGLFENAILACARNFLIQKMDIEIDEHNYKDILTEVFYREDYKKDPDGLSGNCFKGRNGHIPNLIVCHINHTYASAIERFYNEESQVSSHYVIRRDGHVKQVVGLDDSAWANGTSSDPMKDNYKGFATSEIVRNADDNANYFSFSIEHESFDGSLTKQQLDTTIGVMQEIIAYLKNKYNYDFLIDRQHIIGHSDVNPITRGKCPGEKFPFDEIIDELKRG